MKTWSKETFTDSSLYITIYEDLMGFMRPINLRPVVVVEKAKLKREKIYS